MGSAVSSAGHMVSPASGPASASSVKKTVPPVWDSAAGSSSAGVSAALSSAEAPGSAEASGSAVASDSAEVSGSAVASDSAEASDAAASAASAPVSGSDAAALRGSAKSSGDMAGVSGRAAEAFCEAAEDAEDVFSGWLITLRVPGFADVETAAAFTVTLQVLFLPLAVLAVIVAVPAFFAVIVPP